VGGSVPVSSVGHRIVAHPIIHLHSAGRREDTASECETFHIQYPQGSGGWHAAVGWYCYARRAVLRFRRGGGGFGGLLLDRCLENQLVLASGRDSPPGTAVALTVRDGCGDRGRAQTHLTYAFSAARTRAAGLGAEIRGSQAGWAGRADCLNSFCFSLCGQDAGDEMSLRNPLRWRSFCISSS
jgi:hypothetical protein